MSEAVGVVLIAAGAAVTSFFLTYLLAIRLLRRSLSTRSGKPLADILDKGSDQMVGHFDRIDHLDRIEWSSRLLRRELQKSS